ncbi:MAG: DUF1015 family protein [Candidatus Thermoplasmatota archaeon]|nr:DUF1015 family protein [Candidatus Thermoplasmatota archaeon]
MVAVKEFAGYRHKEPQEFALKPYDVISDAEATEMRKNYKSGIFIEIPLGEGEEKYKVAAKETEKFSKELIVDEPSIYVYEESSKEFTQRGFVVCASLQDYLDGKIKIHEKTREAPLKDRIKHLEATKTNTGLIWLIFRKNGKIKRMMSQIQKEKPIIEFPKYGFTHKVWKVSDKETIQKVKDAFAPLELYIADGHHRCASAAEIYKRRVAEGKPNGEHAYVEAFCASEDELRIMPYNRIIRKLPMPFDALIEKMGEKFKVKPAKKDKPAHHEVLMYGNRQWWSVKPKKVPKGDVESLDVSIIQNDLLAPILGIADPRKDPNIFFEGGVLTKADMQKFGDAGNDLVLYMHPTSMKELMRVADAKKDMPPKSTWFDPKLLSLLVFHKID